LDLQPLALAWFEQQRQLEPSFPRRIACSLITPTIRALLKGTSKHVHLPSKD
jgi:hypothetical protein